MWGQPRLPGSLPPMPGAIAPPIDAMGPLASVLAPPPPPMAAAMGPKHKLSILGIIADALSGAAGQPGAYAQRMMQRRQQEAQQQRELEQQARSETDYQRHRADSNTDWTAHQQWELEHPKPQGPMREERLAELSGLKPGTPEYQTFMRGFADPVVTVTRTDANGGMITEYVPRSQLLGQGQTPPTVLDDLPPQFRPVEQGGAGSGGPRTFR